MFSNVHIFRPCRIEMEELQICRNHKVDIDYRNILRIRYGF